MTHEPVVAWKWPDGHVSAQLTGLEHEECVKVTVHGVDHFLHSSTAMALFVMLGDALDDYNDRARALGLDGVDADDIRTYIGRAS